MASSVAPKGNGKARIGPKIAAAVTVILGLVLVLLVFFGHRGFYQMYLLRQEKTRLELENLRLSEENTRLGRTVDRLQNDPEMIQDLIRRELNFVKKNELIIQLPPEGKDKPIQATRISQKPPSAAKGGATNSRLRGRKRQAPGVRKKTP